MAANGTSSTPSLESLIAKYGDSSNTTWVEDKFDVWRHEPTGAAQGYSISSDDYLIAWGNPLCDKSQYPEVAKAFLQFIDEQKRKPIWACLNQEMEEFLAKNYEWRAVFCVQEDILDPTTANPESDKEVRKHIRQAEKAGCRIIEERNKPPENVMKEIDRVIEEWKAGRKGLQVHVTNVEPWRDFEHRRYFYVRDKENKICAFMFIAQVEKGWAIKDSIQGKGAPKAITEWLITAAIHSLASDDVHHLTFGPTPAAKLQPVANITGNRVKLLTKSYSGIESAFLGNKREFRQKFEVEGTPLFVCYPPHGLGRHGISALMKVLTD